MRCASRLLLLAGAAAFGLILSSHGAAQDFPTKPVRVVVPYSPGGIVDLRARQFAQKMSGLLGQAVFVDNKPGASGAIGADLVAKSPADGYTLLFGTINELAIYPAVGAQRSYDPATDFAAISLAAAGYPTLLVTPGLEVKSVGELIGLVKSRPGHFNFASAGSGTLGHFLAGYFATQIGLNVSLIPYKGNALADLMSGQVQMMFGYTLEFASLAKAGRVKPLAVFGPRRVPVLGDVPTIAEAGYPGFETHAWQGFFAPKGTPASVVSRLSNAIAKVGTDAQMQRELHDAGSEFIAMSPAEFGVFYRQEIEKWAKIVKDSGVKIE